MLLLIVLIIIVASVWILWNIYFHFFNFQQNFQDLNNYQNSYYWAISAIERWLLSSKYMWYWYEGSTENLWTWWNISDIVEWEFWNFTNWLFFGIDSKTQETSWKIKYDKITTIKLVLNTGENIYSGENQILNFFDDSSYISGIVKSGFSISGANQTQLKRVIALDNGNGYIIANKTWNEFSNWKINEWANFYFSNGTRNIFNPYASEFSGFKNSWTPYNTIWEALSGGKAVEIHFYITGINYLLTDNNKIVPYLDFEINSNLDFVDSYYYINWVSIYWKYKQNLSVKRPVSNYQNPNYKNFIFPYYNE